ncbi:dihydrodipicolinate synthase family protein [Salinarimonas sp.]|uniref:dihydrodipicolinate synthase family protein n=1 Tax=Salinarimonas sp. TaxID=2766526 RepID=UPI00391CC779
MNVLRGVLPVLPTPFDETGAIDEPAFQRLVAFALDAGADGIVYPGMASEVETLSDAERTALVAALGRRLEGRIPFVVGASAPDPAKAAAHARAGATAGAVAAMVMAPAAAGRDVDRHVAFFSAVARETSLPLMLQNAPAPNGAGLAPEAVVAIVQAVPAIRYVKEETLPCGQNVGALVKAHAGRLDAVFGGAGARYVLEELARGAAGTMPALEIADFHVALVRAYRRGAVAQARLLYRESLPLLLVQAIFRVRLTKEVLARRGLLASTVARAAGPALDDEDRAEIARILADLSPQLPCGPVLPAKTIPSETHPS